MLILVRTAFFLQGIQTIQFHKKTPNKHSQTDILIKITKETANYYKSLKN